MVALEPSQRPTFDTLLHTSRGSAFPECFYSFLHNYVSSINELSSAFIFTKSSPPIAEGHSSAEPTILPSDSDHRLEKIWTEYDSVEPYLLTEAVEQTVTKTRGEPLSTTNSIRRLEDIFPVELHIPNYDAKLRGALAPHQHAALEGCSLFLSSPRFINDLSYILHNRWSSVDNAVTCLCERSQLLSF